VLNRWATTRLVRHELRYGSLNLPLRLGIYRAGGLIEHQDRGIQGERSGKAEQLTLPHAKTSAALPEAVAVSVGQTLDEPVRPNSAGGQPGGLGRDRRIQGKVVLNVSREKEEILLDEADQRSKVGGRELPDIDAIDQNSAPVRVVEAQQQIDDGGLPCSGVPNQRNRLAR
jgi:hypothetical protein